MAFAQRFEWSEAFEMSSVYNTNQVLDANKEQVYLLQKYKDENFYFHQKLTRLNKAFEPTESDNFLDLLEYKDNKLRLQFPLKIQDQSYLCFSANDNGLKKETLLLGTVDKGKLHLEPNFTALFDIDYNNKTHDFEGYRAVLSEDQSKLMVLTRMPYTSKRDFAEIGLYIGDTKSFKQLTAGAVRLPQKNKKVELSDVTDALVDNEGNAYFLFKKYKNKDKKEERKIGTRFYYGLAKMDKKGKVSVLDTLNVLEKKDSAIIVSAKLSYNPTTKKVSCIGTYKNPSNPNNSNLFACRLDNDAWGTSVKIVYPEAFATASYVTPKQAQNKHKYGLKHYKINEIWEQENGDQILIAEQHYNKVYFDKSVGRQEIHKINNIYVAQLSNNKIEWITALPKRQEGGGVNYTNIPDKLYSYFAFEQAGQVHFLYNDLESNLSIEDELELEKIDCNHPQKAVLVQATLDLTTGELLGKKKLLDYKSNGLVVYPQSMLRLDEHSFLLLGMQPEEGAKVKSKFLVGRLQLNTEK